MLYQQVRPQQLYPGTRNPGFTQYAAAQGPEGLLQLVLHQLGKFTAAGKKLVKGSLFCDFPFVQDQNTVTVLNGTTD